MPTIRRATVADADAVYDLQDRLWPDDISDETKVAALLARDDFAAFLAEHDGKAIGLAEVTLHHYVDGTPDGLSSFLEGVYVAGHNRRAGIAKALLAAVETWVRLHGVTHLGSNAEVDNAPGLAWHRAAGFAETGSTINFAKPL